MAPKQTCQIAVPRGKYVEYSRYVKHPSKKEAQSWLESMREIGVMTKDHKVFECKECKGFHIKKK